jgi:hypothetical protein
MQKKDKVIEKFDTLSLFSSIFSIILYPFKFILSPITNLFSSIANYCYICCLICCCIMFAPMLISMFKSLAGSNASYDE